MNDASHLRIGELSRRSGVSPELLRAWERRYDLLQPTRSPGGLRLYSLEDLERVRLMSRHIANGLAAREAAALAGRAALGGEATPDAAGGAPAAGPAPGAPFDPRSSRAALGRAVEAFDEPAAQAIFDELLAEATIDALLSEVVVPFLHDVGDRWERGELSVAQEHFASNLLRGRLLGLARGWGGGSGPPRPARLPARRASRPRTDRLRAGAARARLAHRLPRQRTRRWRASCGRRTRSGPTSSS